MIAPVFAILLDPYRGGSRVVTVGELVDRAALAECRAAPVQGQTHHQRWQHGRPTACADHLAEAIAAARDLGLL